MVFNYKIVFILWLPHASCVYLEQQLCTSSAINHMHLQDTVNVLDPIQLDVLYP